MRARLLGIGVVLMAVGYCAGEGGGGLGVRDADGAEAEKGMVLVPQSAVAPLPEGLGAEEKRDIDVFRRASSSVVHITNIGLARDFFTFDVFEIPQGTGSGFVWDKRGHVVTNYHVIEGGRRFSVRLGDQSEFDAEVVGAAPEKDLAVLRIEAPAERLAPVAPGRSRDLAVGQRVLAIGNPFGLDQTLTVGVVSALGREITSPAGRRIRDVIQTDAAINPGNSGGPLLDSSGRLIGVNATIRSPSGASAGIGFAIPVDTVARIVPQLISRGKTVQPGIGIRTSVAVENYLRRNGIEGVAVLGVADGSPAEKADLRAWRITRSGRIVETGDVIVAVDGKPIETLDDLQDAFEAAGVGAEVRLTVLRGKSKKDVRVRLASLEAQEN